MAELTADGLGVKVPPHHAFDPWPVPASMRIECTCLEAPKVIEHNGYFYLNVAEGGTAGPSTSHSVVSARSPSRRRSVGSIRPNTPIVHTASRESRWFSVGHGRLVDTPEGRWFMTVHAYENGYRALGRQTLLLPIEWTADGWVSRPRRRNRRVGHPHARFPALANYPSRPLDDFHQRRTRPAMGLLARVDQARFSTGQGVLNLKARGSSLADSPALTTPVGGHSYTVEVDVEIAPGCSTGLLLFYDPSTRRILLDGEGIGVRIANGYVPAASRRAQPAPLCASSMTTRKSISTSDSPAKAGKDPRIG